MTSEFVICKCQCDKTDHEKVSRDGYAPIYAGRCQTRGCNCGFFQAHNPADDMRTQVIDDHRSGRHDASKSGECPACTGQKVGNRR